MPFYYGKSKDGSDMKEFEGMYVSSCGQYWSSDPFTPEIEEQLRQMSVPQESYLQFPLAPFGFSEVDKRKKKPCEAHEYTKRENGKWLCRHCERDIKS